MVTLSLARTTVTSAPVESPSAGETMRTAGLAVAAVGGGAPAGGLVSAGGVLLLSHAAASARMMTTVDGFMRTRVRDAPRYSVPSRARHVGEPSMGMGGSQVAGLDRVVTGVTVIAGDQHEGISSSP